MRFFYGKIKMVASTDVKFYVHSNSGAPQLQNTYGSMINVLNACLVEGISIGTVSSLTVLGTTATALFSSSHNLMQYQVIKITGANQSEFNGEHRILAVPDAQSVTFELEAQPNVSNATGVIEVSLPPLGWEKPLSSSHQNVGGKAAYRSKSLLLPSRPFLRVVDEPDPAYNTGYAKFAKVGMVEDMTDIETMTGVEAPFDPVFPQKNWVGTGSGISAVNGWARWYYARSGDAKSDVKDSTSPGNGVREYILIGTDEYFYIINSTAYSGNYGQVYGFGAYDSLEDGYAFNNFLSATLNSISVDTWNKVGEFTPIANNNDGAYLITERLLSRHDNYGLSRVFSSALGNGGVSGSVNSHTYRSNTAAFPVYISGEGLYGKLRGCFHLANKEPYTHKQIISRLNKAYIALSVAKYSNITGQMIFEIGDIA